MMESNFLNLLSQIAKPENEHASVKQYLFFVTERIFNCISPTEISLYENNGKEITPIYHFGKKTQNLKEVKILLSYSKKNEKNVSRFELEDLKYTIFNFSDNFQMAIVFGLDKENKSNIEKWTDLLFNFVSSQIKNSITSPKFINSISDSISGVIYRFEMDENGNGLLHYLSKGFEKLTGIESEDFIEDWDFEKYQNKYLHPEDKASFLDSIKLSYLNLSPWQLEFRVKDINGSFKWIFGSGIVEKNIGKSVVWTGTLLDIDNYKKTQSDLGEIRENFEMLAQNLHFMTYEADQYWKPKVLYNCNSIIGFTKDELFNPDFNWLDIIHPEDRDRVYNEGSELQTRIKELVQVYRIVNNNKIIWVRDHKRSLLDKSGNFCGVNGILSDITDSTEQERNLEEQKINYQLLAENSSNVVGQISAKGELVYLSPSCFDLTGFKSEEIYDLGKILEIVHFDDLEKAKEKVIRGIKKKLSLFSFDLRIRTKSKYYIWINAKIKCSYNVDSVFPDIVFNVISIQDIKLQNEQLSQSQNRLLLALNAAGQISYEYNIVEDKFFWSGNVSDKKFGMTFTELQSISDIYKFVYSNDIEIVKENIKEILIGKPKPIFDFRAVDGFGNVIHLRNFAHLVQNENDQPIKLIGVLQDVTAKKEIDLQLEESEQKFRQLAENIEEVLFLKSKDKVLYISPAIQQLLEVGTDQLINLEDITLDYVHKGDFDLVQQKKKNYKNGLLNIKYRIVTPSGKLKWIWVKCSSFKIKSGETRMIGLISDITEQKKLEEELVKERNLAISSTKVKDEFLSLMSHEIRTPINTILSFQNTLSDSIIEQINPNYLKEFKKASSYLNELFSNILFYSDLTSNAYSPVMDKFKLKDLMKELQQEFYYALKTKGLELSIDLGNCELYVIQSAKQYLYSIFYNLISNAINFTDSGGISIKTEISKMPSEKLSIVIQDTGIGISDENIEYIFNPFYTSNPFLSQSENGTGLGLAIVNQLVEKLNGSIKVESNVNIGSIFSISIPITSDKKKSIKYLSTYQSNHLLFKELFISEIYDFRGFRTITYLKKSNINGKSFLIIDWETSCLKDEELEWVDKFFYKVLIIKSPLINLPLNIPVRWMIEDMTMSQERFEFIIK